MSEATKSICPVRSGPVLMLGYAAVVYALFVAVLGYAVGFFADVAVPRGIDQGTHSAWPLAVAIDAGLLLLFAGQHTVMARPWFKRRWTRLVPGQAERTTFVLCSSLALALLFWAWRPVGGMAWAVASPGAAALLALYASGWVVAISSTFMISHCDLFGLRQARASTVQASTGAAVMNAAAPRRAQPDRRGDQVPVPR